MPQKICGANGCVIIPDRNPVMTNRSSIMGYDSAGNPVFAGDQSRAIVSQSPGMASYQSPAPTSEQIPRLATAASANTNPNDPTGRYYHPYPGPYQSHLPLEQRTDLVNGLPPESITYTRGVNERPPQDMRPYTAQVPAGANPIQFGQQHNQQLFPDTLGDRIGNAISNAPSAIGQVLTGSPGSADSQSSGSAGRYTFQPRYPGQLQSQYEQLFGNAINRLNERFSPNSQYGIDPILKQAEQDYYTQTLPGLRESYTRLGGQNSARFPAELQISGQNFATNLAALKAQHGLDEQRQLMQYLNHSPYENVYEAGIPPQQAQQSGPGLLTSLGDIAAQTALGYATGGPAGAAIGGGAGLWNRLRNFLGSNNNQQQPAQYPQPIQQRPVAGAPVQIQSDQQSLLDNISRRAAPGYQLSPQELQQIQSVTGGVGAGEDFARTFKQPQANRLTFPKSPQQQARFAGFNRAGVL